MRQRKFYDNKPRVKKPTGLILEHSFVRLPSLKPFSEYSKLPEQEKNYIKRLRDSLFKYTGFKKVEVYDQTTHSLVGAIGFDDDISDHDRDLLDTLIYIARNRSRGIVIEIDSLLQVDGKPIVFVSAGRFKNGLYESMTDFFFAHYSYCDDNDNEIPFPSNFRKFDIYV